jgi:uncharacterized protein YndB with AHSA1/START domain
MPTDTDRPLATVRREGTLVVLRYERDLRHPTEKVWRAITETEHLRRWFPTDIVGERRAGAEVDFPFWPGHVEKYEIEEPVAHGEIVAWEPPTAFEWIWDDERVRFDLSTTGEGTRLVVTTWIPETGPVVGASAGYHAILDQLALLLDGEDPPQFVPDEVVQGLEARYKALVEG